MASKTSYQLPNEYLYAINESRHRRRKGNRLDNAFLTAGFIAAVLLLSVTLITLFVDLLWLATYSISHITQSFYLLFGLDSFSEAAVKVCDPSKGSRILNLIYVYVLVSIG